MYAHRGVSRKFWTETEAGAAAGAGLIAVASAILSHLLGWQCLGPCALIAPPLVTPLCACACTQTFHIPIQNMCCLLCKSRKKV